MPITPNYRILTNIRNNKDKIIKQIIMTYITEEEELLLDNIKDNYVNLDRENRTFTIKVNNIFCYGDVDFHNDDDLNTINSFKFLNHLDAVGVKIYSNYDYETHTCSSPNKTLLYTETFQPIDLVKYAHGCLNKPKKLILFSQDL